ncbi:hypothetical protein LBW94_036845 [Nocardia sp. alder85J]|nr:hypothetical protein [Nocardia sp. alder85J]MCX4097931.1 hypothetical protein [Nocardia sp. alder85J]
MVQGGGDVVDVVAGEVGADRQAHRGGGLVVGVREGAAESVVGEGGLAVDGDRVSDDRVDSGGAQRGQDGVPVVDGDRDRWWT